jgi:hypothetical protein
MMGLCGTIDTLAGWAISSAAIPASVPAAIAAIAVRTQGMGTGVQRHLLASSIWLAASSPPHRHLG